MTVCKKNEVRLQDYKERHIGDFDVPEYEDVPYLIIWRGRYFEWYEEADFDGPMDIFNELPPTGILTLDDKVEPR